MPRRHGDFVGTSEEECGPGGRDDRELAGSGWLRRRPETSAGRETGYGILVICEKENPGRSDRCPKPEIFFGWKGVVLHAGLPRFHITRGASRGVPSPVVAAQHEPCSQGKNIS